MEFKAGIKKVRTAAGVKRYKQPIGSIIVRDGEPPLDNLTLLKPQYEGTEQVAGPDGKEYVVGYDEDTGGYFAMSADGMWDDMVVEYAEDEGEAFELLNGVLAGKRKKGNPILGSLSGHDDRKAQKENLKAQKARHADLKKQYGDKRKSTYDRTIAGLLSNAEKELNADEDELAQDWLDKVDAQIAAYEYQNNLRERTKVPAKTPVSKKPSRAKKAPAKPVVNTQAEKHFKDAHKRRLKQQQSRIDKVQAWIDSNPPAARSEVEQAKTDLAVAQSRLNTLDALADDQKQYNAQVPGVEDAIRKMEATKDRGTSKAIGSAKKTYVKKKVGKYEVELINTTRDFAVTELHVRHEGTEYTITVPKTQRVMDQFIAVRNETTGQLFQEVIPSREQEPSAAERQKIGAKALETAFGKAVKRNRNVETSDTAELNGTYDEYVGTLGTMLKTDQQRATLTRLITAMNKGNHKQAQKEYDALKNQIEENGARPNVGAKLKAVKEDIEALAGTTQSVQKSDVPDLSGKPPRDIDTELARIFQENAQNQVAIEAAVVKIHRAVDTETSIWDKAKAKTIRKWGMSDDEAIEAAKKSDEPKAQAAYAEYTKKQQHGKALELEAKPYNEEFQKRKWSRFFLVTSSDGHIHSSMSCSTTTWKTRWAWLPEVSGKSEKEAVDEHGPNLCTVCFPSAPVEWTRGVEDPTLCPGSGTMDYDRATARLGYYSGNSGTCNVCGQRITVSKLGRLRKHKKD